jgi:hypothetical protein
MTSALLTDDAFSSSTSIREQCFHTCRIYCVITPKRTRCLLGSSFSGALPTPQEKENEEDLDIREYADQVEPRFIGIERGEGDGGF